MMLVSNRFLLATAVLASSVYADLYMHFPPGANNRNRERQEDRQNDNRMYDTQNNGKGGYPWNGDRELIGKWDGYQFYTGSILRIEWTAQHGAGPDADVDAQVILQYSCDQPTGTTSAAAFTAADPRALYYSEIGPPQFAPRDGYPTGPLEEADAGNAGQYKQASYRSVGQNTNVNQGGTNTIQCPSGIGCPGPNFGNGDSLNTDVSRYTAFYDNLTITAATGGNTGTYYPVEFGYHETFQFYRDMCLYRSRNKGLYTADQNLNGESARYTRQNPNGGRSGLECPEERDYYPWWNPSPWRDIAILVSDLGQCEYYKQHSQNVEERWYCRASDADIGKTRMPLTKDACTAASSEWVKMPSFGIAAPDCLLHPVSRDNHLGNVVRVTSATDGSAQYIASYPEAAYYDWKVPDELAGKYCVVRMRYNMSSSDYPQSNWQTTSFVEDLKYRSTSFWDSRFNCPATTAQTEATGQVPVKEICRNIVNNTFNPVFNRPYINVTSRAGYAKLSIAFNTDQVARTFQDRSYVLKFAAKPSGFGTIYNLNFRGRRGNIVQCYPAVENDFTPAKLSITTDDAVHIQFCGSDFNPNNNPNNGEGWRYSTRVNMLKLPDSQRNFPTHLDQDPLFGNSELALRLAFGGMNASTRCVNFQGNNNDATNNDITNCGKLNPAKACVDYGVQKIAAGTYNYVCTRGNNFSNRAMKGVLTVTTPSKELSMAAKTGIGVGVAAGAVLMGVAGLVLVAKKRPGSKVGRFVSSLAGSGQMHSTGSSHTAL